MINKIRSIAFLAMFFLPGLLVSISPPQTSARSVIVADPESDTTPPVPVVDLIANTGVTPGSVDLTWTSPGNDGLDGPAAAYIIRYGSEPIDETNWETAGDVTGEPIPSPAGTEEYMTVDGLTPGLSYYFSLISEDEAQNASGLSNMARAAAQFYPDSTFMPVTVSGAESTPTVIPDTTKVLPPDTLGHLASVSENGSVYTFSQSTPELDSLKPGDIIVGDVSANAPYGFLRLVIDVASEGGQVVVTTDQGTLEEAFESVEVEVNQELSPDQIRSGSQLDGVTLLESPTGDFTVAMKHVVLYDLDDDENTTDDQCTADGRVTIDPGFKFNLKIKRFKLSDLSSIITADEKADLTVACNLAFHFTKELEVGRWSLGTYTVMAGYVPLVFTPQLTMYIGLDGSVRVGLSTSLVQESSMRVGVRYDGDNWHAVRDFTNHFEYIPPTLSAGIDAKAYTGARISIQLYGTTGNYAQIDNYLKLEVNLNAVPWWKFYGGLTVRYGFEIALFTKTVADIDWVLIDERWLIAQAPITKPPNQPANPSPPNLATDVSLNTILSWTGGDPEGDSVTYDVWFEVSDVTPDVLLCNDATTTTCNPGPLTSKTKYYWYVIATDQYGLKVDGPLWRFTTLNTPPNQPANPAPPNSANGVLLNTTLSWTGGDLDGDAVTYDVYLWAYGTQNLVCDNVATATCNPGPLSFNQYYRWFVRATDSHGASTTGPVWNFTTTNRPPNQPADPSPPNHAEVTSDIAQLGWKGGDPDGDAVIYDVYLTANDYMPDIPLCNDTPFQFCAPGTLKTNTQYYWQVVATDRSGATTNGPIWDFTTLNKPPEIPANPSPENGATKVSPLTVLSWQIANPDGEALSYDIYVEAGDDTPDILLCDNVTVNTCSPGGLLSNTRYYWQVVATDPYGASTTGPVWNFTTTNRPPNQPTAPSPENHASQVDVNTGLSWSGGDPDGDPVTYDVYLLSEDDMQPVLLCDNTSTTTCQPATLDRSLKYYWQVVATDSRGAETGSPVWDFTTTRTPSSTSRVSIASDGTQANWISRTCAISANGRFVSFSSEASNLVPGDTNNSEDVFVHDRLTGQTSRVSVSTDGSQGQRASGSGHDKPAISADGRFVAFNSFAWNFTPGDANDTADVFVHDRQTGQTSRVSVASDGTEGNQISRSPAISDDGRFVAFSSRANTLIPEDTNSTFDVFVHDRQTGQTSRVSVASDGTQGNSDSGYGQVTISGNGRFVAFDSSATNLVPGDTNETEDIFIHDRKTGYTSRVSVASDGTQGNKGSYYGLAPSSYGLAISADGRFVAFASYASNLVLNDTNDTSDIFIRDRQTGQTSRVSIASDGSQGNGLSLHTTLSADGRFVAFMSEATNLSLDDSNWYSDIFVHDRQTGQTSRVSVASDDSQGNGPSQEPAISADGRFVGFVSRASNLVLGDTNDVMDVFVHDRGE